MSDFTKPSTGDEVQPMRSSFMHKNMPERTFSARSGKGDPDDDTKVNVVIEPSKPTPTWRQSLLNLVDSTWFSIVSTVVTIWALFGQDIQLACTDKSTDGIFEGLTIACLAFFTLELIGTSIAKPDDYFMGFYFWLDFVATASMVFDIPQVFDAITASMGDDSDAASSTTVLKAGRASRAGTKAGRIARLVRLIRILKLYKQYIARKEELRKGNLVVEEEEEENQSRVGQKLSDLTTRRVIIGVLAMLFMLPLFDLKGGYYDEPLGLDYYGLEMLHKMHQAGQDAQYAAIYDSSVQTFKSGVKASKSSTGGKTTHKIYHLVICDEVIISGAHKRPDFRKDLETLEYAYTNDESTCISMVYFDTQWESQLQAILNIMRTLFICIILLVGAMSFSKDANQLVLIPIERMIKKVRLLADNPLAGSKMKTDNEGEDAQYETRILENAFIKISSLLAIGFGDAGAEIIGENMKSGGNINAMVPGRKMYAIFGFCDIRQFTDATEVLQEGIMEFVNSIAKIVHMEVAMHGGSANKNIGDAFLLVWKFPEGTTAADLKNVDSLPTEKRDAIKSLADKALASFIIIMSGLKRSKRLNRYRSHPGLNERMPNYDVKMGFGLHAGWAIEGAIGSDYKIDASYLLPNVNMSSRLEAATKQFRTPLLLSKNFVDLMSPSAFSMCRQIDCVTVKGSNEPMGLYTFDTDLTAVDSEPQGLTLNSPSEKEEQEAEIITYSHHEYTDEFKENPDITKVHNATPEFLQKFGEAFQAYIDGDWGKSRDMINAIIEERVDSTGEPVRDGPSETLLEVMARENFQAPKDWEGYRALTEK